MDTCPASDLPGNPGHGLSAVHAYWLSLRRGSATIPFADDFRLRALQRIEGETALLSVFHKPLRFQFASAGRHVLAAYGGEIEGIFLDELDAHHPLEEATAQARETAEHGVPTVYNHDGGRPVYARLMLPLWGEGEINAVLIAFDFVPEATR